MVSFAARWGRRAARVALAAASALLRAGASALGFAIAEDSEVLAPAEAASTAVAGADWAQAGRLARQSATARKTERVQRWGAAVWPWLGRSAVVTRRSLNKNDG
jgi:hypothetical protein